MSAIKDLRPTITDIRRAAERLDGLAFRTPLLENVDLNDKTGGRILLKAECLQRTGSFKFRGAYNAVSQMDPEIRSRGVLAWSSGNHAQGLAAAAKLHGISATIVMPKDAPDIKVANAKRLGATIVPYDRYNEVREEIGGRIAEEHGLTIIPPYDNEHIVAGQGTVGLEIDAQCQEMGTEPDAILLNCSGGGLTAGCAVAMTANNPATEIYCVEPEFYDDHAQSLANGTRTEISTDKRSICDSLLTPIPGEVTFPINKELLSGGLTVTDDEIRDAIVYAFERLKLVVEPGGAASLAAILTGRIDCKGRTVCAVLSGGNITKELFAEIISSGSSSG